MLLQTLVENAITHGIAELPDGGVLKVSTLFVDQRITYNTCALFGITKPFKHRGVNAPIAGTSRPRNRHNL